MTKGSIMRGFLLAGAAFAGATSAHAQTAAETTAQTAVEPPAADATAGTDNEGSGEEIIVTARRTMKPSSACPRRFRRSRTHARRLMRPTTGLQGAVPPHIVRTRLVHATTSTSAASATRLAFSLRSAVASLSTTVYLDEFAATSSNADLERLEVLAGRRHALGKTPSGRDQVRDAQPVQIPSHR